MKYLMILSVLLAGCGDNHAKLLSMASHYCCNQKSVIDTVVFHDWPWPVSDEAEVVCNNETKAWLTDNMFIRECNI